MTEHNVKTDAMEQGRKPMRWIPTLYMAEGLPYFAVNTMSVLIYKQMGISNAEMTFYTGWLYLPWVIKPFWSPFVDIIKTKRWWTISMQYLIGVAMAAIAFLLPGSFFFVSTLAVFWLMAFFSATHDIAADGYYMLELSQNQQAAYVGLRSTFYRIASVVGQGALVVVAGFIQNLYPDNVPISWSVVFVIMSVFFLLTAFYHSFVMPKALSDKPNRQTNAIEILEKFGATFVTFFKKRNIVTAIAFMLFYRFPEALMLKLAPAFLIDDKLAGGLGLTIGQVGIVNGTVGVIGLLLGGIVGGFCIARSGLKFWLWPMALALTLPCAFYCYLAIIQPTNFVIINAGIFIEQFGYGFGFTAFMLYLIHFSEGEFKTSHYAFCTAFMALGMMLPGMAAGWLEQQLSALELFDITIKQGYINFFLLVMLCCLPTYIVCSLVKIDSQFGKKKV